MKTSNKLLIGTGICIVLGIFSFAFMMRGAYQKALANPLANELRIGLKAMKYLNIEYDSYVTFKHGNKYEVVINKTDKDSLRIDYQGDMLNLKVGDIGNITVYTPQLPIMSFTKNGNLRNKDAGEITIDSSFQSGDFVITSLKNTHIELRKCHFDKVDIQSKNKTDLLINESEVKSLNLILSKNSTLGIVYSNILSKNIVLGDSCNVSITGNQSSFLK
jgi:beta-mannanase